MFLEDRVCYDQQNGQSTSLELDLGSKARFEERVFQEREANLQAAFWQVVGVVRNYSPGHSVNFPRGPEYGSSDSSARKS